MTDAWLDDRPIEDYGVQVTSLDGWWHPVAGAFPASPIPGRRGAEPTERGLRVPARRLPLGLLVQPTSLADRVAKLDALAQAMTGLLEFRVSDDPERVGYCTLEAGSTEFFGPQLVHPALRARYELVFENPTKYARRPDLLVLPTMTAPVSVPCGTAPHRGRLWVLDQLAGRNVDVLAGDGTLLYRLRLTGTLAANEYLEIDCDRDAPTITHVKSSGAVRVDAFHWLHPLDAFPIFDPADRPALLHGGGGSLVYFYRRAYAA